MAKSTAVEPLISASELRNLRAELAEEHELRMSLKAQVCDLTSAKDLTGKCLMAFGDGMIVERNELLARVNRLEHRCRALGRDIGVSIIHGPPPAPHG